MLWNAVKTVALVALGVGIGLALLYVWMLLVFLKGTW